MLQNRKLIIASFLIIFSGLGFVWFGLKPAQENAPPVKVTDRANGEKVNQATSAAAMGMAGERAVVTEVVDGDTIKVVISGKEYTVRYIGMDTPETVDPRRPVGCFGKEASNENKSLLSGKVVVLQKDISETDKYGRLLRYVYLPLEDGSTLFVNDYLVREGFARILTYPPDVKYTKEFLEAEKQAREGKKGLWSKC